MASFLDLPPELRERIYIELLVTDVPISLEHRVGIPYVAQVSRIVREESLGVFWGKNRFAITNRYGHSGSLAKVCATLQYMARSHLASIKHLRLDWNTYCSTNYDMCFEPDPAPIARMCPQIPHGYPAPVYMVACYIELTRQAPWFEMAIDCYNNDLCRPVGKPLYQDIHGLFSQLLKDPLFAGHCWMELDADLLVNVLSIWQIQAQRRLLERFRQLPNQPFSTYPHRGNGNHALQDYQMQLMLLEQQNKKRLLMARQEQDEMAGPPSVDPASPPPSTFTPHQRALQTYQRSLQAVLTS